MIQFVVSIVLICLLLIAVLAIVAYIFDRFQIGVKSDAQTGPAVSNNPAELYYIYQSDYEYFNSRFHRYINDAQDKLGLDCPSYVSGIQCEDIQNRVSYQQGRLIFRYEVPRKMKGLFEGGGRRIQNADVPTTKIAQAIDLALPAYIKPHFSYAPPVVVYDIPRNRVRIEVINPVRNYPA